MPSAPIPRDVPAGPGTGRGPEREMIWLHVPRGGYGYVFRIPCIVIGQRRARVKVAVLTAEGQLKTRFVRQESLVPIHYESERERYVLHCLHAALAPSVADAHEVTI